METHIYTSTEGVLPFHDRLQVNGQHSPISKLFAESTAFTGWGSDWVNNQGKDLGGIAAPANYPIDPFKRAGTETVYQSSPDPAIENEEESPCREVKEGSPQSPESQSMKLAMNRTILFPTVA